MTTPSPQAQAIADALNANATAITRNTAIALAAQQSANEAITAGQQAAADLAAILAAQRNVDAAVAAQTAEAVTPPIIISPSQLSSGVTGQSYNAELTASGGVGGSFNFAISAGSLPPGLSMTAGLISGTPTAGGSTFTVSATDSVGNAGLQVYTLAVSGA